MINFNCQKEVIDSIDSSKFLRYQEMNQILTKLSRGNMTSKNSFNCIV